VALKLVLSVVGVPLFLKSFSLQEKRGGSARWV
jgi:hypothetical protein